MQIRPIGKSDRAQWLRMRCALWPGHDVAHGEEIDRYFSGSSLDPQAVLVAEESGILVGFAELSIRSHAEGCLTHRVGYLEGWYVDIHARRRGIGRGLVKAAEDWARTQSCQEFASDTEVSNVVSALAHQALGFEEVESIRCFRKTL
jgi:aminoglycoside 6'-N-acetyltransferase I